MRYRISSFDHVAWSTVYWGADNEWYTDPAKAYQFLSTENAQHLLKSRIESGESAVLAAIAAEKRLADDVWKHAAVEPVLSPGIAADDNQLFLL